MPRYDKILTNDFNYELPEDFIAQEPVEPRDASRLLVYNRRTKVVTHTIFNQISHYLAPGDVLVINETRVIKARLYAHKLTTGGKVEILLLKKSSERLWEAIVGGKRVKNGLRVQIVDGPQAEIVEVLEGSKRIIQFDESVESFIDRAGHVPLPPYIRKELQHPERYQTVYSRTSGSAAAPTAGLHFTDRLLGELVRMGVQIARVTLHVGLDTFAPVEEKDPHEHVIHTEWCRLSPESAKIINLASRQGKRIIAVGTTSVRTLESAAANARAGDRVAPMEGNTDLFILPGYKFRAVDGLITNFHLPKSTLLMLVSAFAGREKILALYNEAKQERYRFYSFGDAMLIQ